MDNSITVDPRSTESEHLFSIPLVGVSGLYCGTIRAYNEDHRLLTFRLRLVWSLLTFYFSTLPDNFFAIAGVAVRSSITKLVTDEEQGKMNAFTAEVEALVFCISSSFYAAIYSMTLVDFPGAFYLISVALTGFGFMAFW